MHTLATTAVTNAVAHVGFSALAAGVTVMSSVVDREANQPMRIDHLLQNI